MVQLQDGFFGDVSHDQGLVVDIVSVFLFDDAQDRSRGEFPKLGVDGSQDRILIHDDPAGGQGDQGSPRHGEMRDEDGDRSLAVRQGMGDLGRGQDESSGRMENQVDGRVRIRHLDGPENFFGVLDIDVAQHRKAEQAHGLLAVDHRDDLRAPRRLEMPEGPLAGHLEKFSGHDRLHHGHQEEKPDQIA